MSAPSYVLKYSYDPPPSDIEITDSDATYSSSESEQEDENQYDDEKVDDQFTVKLLDNKLIIQFHISNQHTSTTPSSQSKVI